MLLAENGHVVSGSGSKDGSAAIWNPDLVKDINKTVKDKTVKDINKT